MRNKYKGKCFICGNEVPPGNGDFQSKAHLPERVRKRICGRWVIRCFSCKGAGNIPKANSPFYKYL